MPASAACGARTLHSLFRLVKNFVSFLFRLLFGSVTCVAFSVEGRRCLVPPACLVKDFFSSSLRHLFGACDFRRSFRRGRRCLRPPLRLVKSFCFALGSTPSSVGQLSLRFPSRGCGHYASSFGGSTDFSDSAICGGDRGRCGAFLGGLRGARLAHPFVCLGTSRSTCEGVPPSRSPLVRTSRSARASLRYFSVYLRGRSPLALPSRSDFSLDPRGSVLLGLLARAFPPRAPPFFWLALTLRSARHARAFLPRAPPFLARADTSCSARPARAFLPRAARVFVHAPEVRERRATS